MEPSTATKERIAGAFADVGMACVAIGVLPEAARSLAEQLVAEGHGEALAALTAEVWMVNEAQRSARLARRDRWQAHAAAYRAGLDPGEMEPPPPPTKPVDPPPDPKDDPPPPPTKDSAPPGIDPGSASTADDTEPGR